MTPGSRAALFSLGVALSVLGLKLAAFLLTDSVALLSDAAESVVNVAAALSVLVAVRLALRPPDFKHPYGHHKAEYLSSAFEGTLILLAAGMILVTAVQRLFEPPTLENVGVGVGVAVLALVLNGGAALLLQRVARRLGSAALLSNARHLLTDVWTSAGVIVGVVLVAWSGRTFFDPLLALLVGLNIVREGWRVMVGALSSLLDVRLPERDEAVILDVLDAHPEVRGYHRLRTRRAGTGRFAEVDIFVDPNLSVAQAHDLVVMLEDDIHAALPNLVTTIHVEPLEAGRREGATLPRDEY